MRGGSSRSTTSVLLVLASLFAACDRAPTTPPPRTGSPPLEISLLPKGEPAEWTDASFPEGFRVARGAGFSVGVWRHQWGDLEPQVGTFAWGDLDYEMQKSMQERMEVCLVVEFIHTNTIGELPDGISFRGFDDEAYGAELRLFLGALIGRYPGQIHQPWIGNEVDVYLHDHPDQIAPFLELSRELIEMDRTLDERIVAGTAGAYYLARKNGELPVLQEMASQGDAIALTISMEDESDSLDVADATAYLEEMLALFPATRVAIIETAWSSGGERGSEARQAQYVRSLARVVRGHASRFLLASWFLLYDLSPDLNRDVAASFGISPSAPPDPPACAEFLAWPGSLALRRNDGGPKEARGVWMEEMAR